MMDPVDGRGRRRQRSVDGVHTGVDGNARIPEAPRRLRWTMMPIAMMAMSACGAHAAITTHDDGMTYCWSVGASVYTTTVNDATPVQEAKSTDCVMTMSLVLDKATYYATEAIDITWSAKLRRNDSGELATNSLGMSELYTAVDRISQMTTQIVYSRIESCLANSTSCDPVTGQTDVITAQANQVANFTDSSVSFSADRVSFDKAGSYRVIAHMILPGQNADQQRYDFAIYRAITVTDRPTLMPVTNSPSESQSQQSASVAEGKGLSTEAICLIFVGGMVAVVLAALGFTMLRKNKKEQLPNSVRKGPDNRSRNDATSTDIDDEFAMLSNDERLMQSLRVPDRAAAGSATSGFLSASVPGEQSMMAESRAIAKSKLEGPVPYVGPSRSKDDDHIVDTTTPASMRADGMYVEMKPAVSTTKHSKLQPGKIYFNDIKEDEVLDDGSHIKKASRGVSMLGVDPFKDALSPRASNVNAIRSAGSRLRHMQGDLEEQVPGQPWRQTSELTFDDLRESADVGPGLSLEDLLESHRKVRVSEDVRDV